MNALFVKKLTTLDFSFLCPERGLVGETWIVDIILSGELNNEGMVFDFGHVKKQLKKVVDHFADHKLLVPLHTEAVQYKKNNGQVYIKMVSHHIGRLTCEAPEQAIAALPVKAITISDVTPWLTDYVKQYLPDNVQGLELLLYPETISGAYYHYSHGLKKHAGDCQRIAHGHRSRLEVTLDNVRSPEAEHRWAGKWCDIYLATKEDRANVFTENGIEYFTFSYTAKQGNFLLILPASCCYVIKTDTTVELLADHAVREIKRWYPEKAVKVMLYEGVDKGAVSVV